MLEVNKIYNEDCLLTLGKMPNDFVDLTVTSPPYDNMRHYTGQHKFDFENIARHLFRVTKPGGVLVWIVNDEIVEGSKTGTSFRQALYLKQMGFKFHDTMIWDKESFSAIGSLKTRYAPVFEFMFIFVKGTLKTFNPIKDKPNKHAGNKLSSNLRMPDGEYKDVPIREQRIGNYGQRYNIWKQCAVRGHSSHPATFPVELACDHIISWSNEGDLIYDPFVGSGTTASAAKILKRQFLGSEISKEYFTFAEQRLAAH